MHHYAIWLVAISGFSITSALTGVAAQWVFSAFVGGMPAPKPDSGTLYVWSYGSLHLLAANLDKVTARQNGVMKP